VADGSTGGRGPVAAARAFDRVSFPPIVLILRAIGLLVVVSGVLSSAAAAAQFT
jgi:hypothetical protein